MAKKQFKAESKRLLDLMINSIYTHKEIFLRELISNASDAIDKNYYRSLSDENINFNKEDYYIRITPQKEERIFTISDTGIGMTKLELEENLGTIAKSGSLSFKNEIEKKDAVDIIGQFGVGFYSAFMVADEVTVISKSAVTGECYKWQSSGTDGYSITTAERDEFGTDIILKIKDNQEDKNYDEFLDVYSLKSLVKKYSDFIKYPIKMYIEKQRTLDEKGEKTEKYIDDETLNSMVPIWRKNKNELKEEDYNNFYRENNFGFDVPLKHIHSSVDGLISYTSILYIPSKAPFDFYTKEYEKGLELYSNGVMIMKKCKDLLPDYFSFVKGIVDSADLSLNISREILQQTGELKFISKKIKEKIKSELISMQSKQRDKYDEFFKSFGRQLKFGVYSEWGTNKEMLQDLLLFTSSLDDKLVSLDEYISRLRDNQKYIYYATGETSEKIKKQPQVELLLDKGYEVLYLTDDVDEFCVKSLISYKEKEFRSANSGNLEIETEEDKKQSEKEKEENKELFEYMQSVLSGKVKEVRASKILKTHPVCLTSDGALSIEMEKVLKMMPDSGNVKAEKVLEINTSHKIFNVIKECFENDKDKLSKYTNLLYNQALLIEGILIEDAVEYTNLICDLMN